MNEERAREKKPWTPPRVECYGSFEEITRQGNCAGNATGKALPGGNDCFERHPSP